MTNLVSHLIPSEQKNLVVPWRWQPPVTPNSYPTTSPPHYEWRRQTLCAAPWHCWTPLQFPIWLDVPLLFPGIGRIPQLPSPSITPFYSWKFLIGDLLTFDLRPSPQLIYSPYLRDYLVTDLNWTVDIYWLLTFSGIIWSVVPSWLPTDKRTTRKLWRWFCIADPKQTDRPVGYWFIGWYRLLLMTYYYCIYCDIGLFPCLAWLLFPIIIGFMDDTITAIGWTPLTDIVPLLLTGYPLMTGPGDDMTTIYSSGGDGLPLIVICWWWLVRATYVPWLLATPVGHDPITADDCGPIWTVLPNVPFDIDPPQFPPSVVLLFLLITCCCYCIVDTGPMPERCGFRRYYWLFQTLFVTTLPQTLPTPVIYCYYLYYCGTVITGIPIPNPDCYYYSQFGSNWRWHWHWPDHCWWWYYYWFWCGVDWSPVTPTPLWPQLLLLTFWPDPTLVGQFGVLFGILPGDSCSCCVLILCGELDSWTGCLKPRDPVDLQHPRQPCQTLTVVYWDPALLLHCYYRALLI